MAISVVLIEDQAEMAKLLQQLIESSPQLLFVASFSTAEDAIKNFGSCAPDVALIDINLPGKSGIDLVRQLKPKFPATQFLMCTSIENPETIFEALKVGASGYLLKATSSAKIQEAIVDVANGGSPMSAAIARKVVSFFHAAELQSNKHLELLSAREKEILHLLDKGFRYKEIADTLFISQETVRTHIRNIYLKLEVNSRTDALNKAFQR